VLLVEDEDELRELVVPSLTDIGVDVVAAASAEAVLADPASWSDIDALITDIVLPGMSGLELAERVRTAKPDLPVLYVTGYADRSSGRRGLVPGARLLRKPYRPDELRVLVASLLETGHGSKR
jgi:CheY-like chemotaxis protein